LSDLHIFFIDLYLFHGVKFYLLHGMGEQLVVHRPHVARHSVFCGLQKHLGKIFKSEISSNWSQ